MMDKRKIKTIKPISPSEYWERQATDGPELELLDKPCHDCAITTDFYTPYADELLEQPEEIQDEVMKRWFCHNHVNKACRGCHNYIKVKRSKK